jgi:YrbI family 3-deoxy-D-manno-octulosonate 8-phosphate phosphatase
MVGKREVLVIIPARGGSKGIPGKNIRSFAGQPLIAYSIAAGLRAQHVTRVIVSTDVEEIAVVARDFGADVPFMRPVEFAQDQSLDLPVFQHALGWLAENERYYPEVVVQLRPTSPIRPPYLVDNAIQLLLDHPGVDSVRGVVPSGQNPFKMWRIDPQNGQMLPLLSVDGIAEPYNAPRQALPETYWQTGHIDAIRPYVIVEQNSMCGKKILPLLIDPRYTVDIDTPSDWIKYERLVYEGSLKLVYPGVLRRPLPDRVDLVVFDFDGVMTDNRVYVDQDGREMVAANRGDSFGINRMRKLGVQAIVISMESNPVVTARCNKLGLPVIQGVMDKPAVLLKFLKENHIDPAYTIFVGNDLQDLPCFPIVACGVAVADAEREVLCGADLVLTRRGGYGAVRELCDIIIERHDKA